MEGRHWLLAQLLWAERTCSPRMPPQTSERRTTRTTARSEAPSLVQCSVWDVC